MRVRSTTQEIATLAVRVIVGTTTIRIAVLLPARHSSACGRLVKLRSETDSSAASDGVCR